MRKRRKSRCSTYRKFLSETDALLDSKLSPFRLGSMDRDLAVALSCDMVDGISVSFLFMIIEMI